MRRPSLFAGYKQYFIVLCVGIIIIGISVLFSEYRSRFFIFIPQAASIRGPIVPSLAPTVDWRFGVGLETWDYSKVVCYTDDPLINPRNGHREYVVGREIACQDSAMQHLRKNTSMMRVSSSVNPDWKLHAQAANVSTFTALDPSANVQMIWYHYQDGVDETRSVHSAFGLYSLSPQQLAFLYAHTDVPGAVAVNINRANTPAGWRIALPYVKMVGSTDQGAKVTYPVCVGCIYHADQFRDYLKKNIDFSSMNLATGKRGWYTFYILAETELTGQPSHHLSPADFAAVLNEYVTTILTWFPEKRGLVSFMPASPTHLEGIGYQQYYIELYQYLLPEVKAQLNLNGLDPFLSYSTPDYDYPQLGIKATTDEDLQIAAFDFNQNIRRASRFFYNLNRAPSLLTQTSVLMVQPPHKIQGVREFSGPECTWCRDNEEVWTTTQHTAARLTQLAYRQLKMSAADNEVAAWSWWQGQRTQYWYESMIDSTWGGISSGVQWLASIDNCTSEADYAYRRDPPMYPAGHPNYNRGYFECAKQLPAGQFRTTPVGDVYLGMANYNYVYRPVKAPSWWPKEDTNTCYFRSVASIRDVNGGSINSNQFIYNYVNQLTPVQVGTIPLGQNRVVGENATYRTVTKDGYIITTLNDIPENFRNVKSTLSVSFPTNSEYVFDHWECESYNYQTGMKQGCVSPSGSGVNMNAERTVQSTSSLNDSILCNTNHFYTWYFRKK